MGKGLRNIVKRALCLVRRCARDGVQYTGEKTVAPRTKLRAILISSVAAIIIAESMEDGIEIWRVYFDVVEWLEPRHKSCEQDVPYWGLLVTYACY